MNPSLLAVAFLIVVVVLWLKLRKSSSAKPSRKTFGHNAVKISVEIAKGTPTSCLLKEGQVYGADFHRKKAPELPCCEGCRCKTEEFVYRSSELFAGGKGEKNGKTFPSDLGNLDFLEYKFYKYSLILLNGDLPVAELEDLAEIRDELKASSAFRRKVERHLDSEEPTKNASP